MRNLQEITNWKTTEIFKETLEYVRELGGIYPKILAGIKAYSTNMPFPAAVGANPKNNCVGLYINPALLKDASIEFRVFVILHECHHVIYNHIFKGISIIKDFPRPSHVTDEEHFRLCNIATDLTINHLIYRNTKRLSQRMTKNTIELMRSDSDTLIAQTKALKEYHAKIEELTNKNGNLNKEDLPPAPELQYSLDALCWVPTVFQDKSISEYLSSEEYLKLLYEKIENNEMEMPQSGRTKVIVTVGGGSQSMPQGEPLSDELMEKILSGEAEVEVVYDPSDVADNHDELKDGISYGEALKEKIEEAALGSNKEFKQQLFGYSKEKSSTREFLEMKRAKYEAHKKFQRFLKKDLRETLKRSERSQELNDWSLENRRIYMGSDYIIPGRKVKKNNKSKHVLLFIDTSGSCVSLAPYFQDLWVNIPKEYEVEAVCFGTDIMKLTDEKFKNKEQGLPDMGGTDFSLLDKYVENNFEEFPKQIIVLSDGECDYKMKPENAEKWTWILPTNGNESCINEKSKIVKIELY